MTFKNFVDAANKSFPEREGVIEALLDSLISGQHVLLLGPPGTAKTTVVEAFAASTGKSFFGVQMHRQLPLEEVFGPLDLTEFEQGKYVRKDSSYAPNAQVVLFDEIFKASGVALNPLLTFLESRTVKQDGISKPVPLEMAVGISNELPESDELGALHDRFICRFWVQYLKEDANFEAMVSGLLPKLTEKLDPALINQARIDMQGVKIGQEAMQGLIHIRDEARSRGISISDRRLNKAVKILKARAARLGAKQVSVTHLQVLENIFWNKQEEIPVLQEIIRAIQPSWMKDIQDINSSLDEIRAELASLLRDKGSRAQIRAGLSKLNLRLLELKESSIEPLLAQEESKQAAEDVSANASNLSREIVKQGSVLGAFASL